MNRRGGFYRQVGVRRGARSLRRLVVGAAALAWLAASATVSGENPFEDQAAWHR